MKTQPKPKKDAKSRKAAELEKLRKAMDKGQKRQATPPKK